MKFKSQLVTAASGSIGGITGARNQGGLYFRARSTPTNPQTDQQVVIRNAVNLASNRWSNLLTEEQRESWRVYAANVPMPDAFGDSRQRSGQQMFIRSFVPRLQMGLAFSPVDNAPTTFSLGELGTQAATLDAGEDQADVTIPAGDWKDDNNGFYLVWASRPQSQSIRFFKGPYRFAAAIQGSDAAPPSGTETIDLPFPFAVGNRIFFRVRLALPDGRLTSSVRFSADAE